MKSAVPAPRRPRRLGRMLGTLLIAFGGLAMASVGFIYGRGEWENRLPDVEAGTIADVHVVTPIPLSVVDEESTERLRAQTLQQIPPLFRYDSQTSERAATRFLEKYDSTQLQFQRRLRGKWQPPLTDEEISSPEFYEFCEAFQAVHPSFPVDRTTAVVWAAERTDELRRNVVHQIRELQRLYILADTELPANERNFSEYLILNAGDSAPPTSIDAIREKAHVLPAKSVRRLTEVQQELATQLNQYPKGWTAFVSTLLEPNLSFDSSATESARRMATNALIVHKDYDPGETVIEAGDTITPTQIDALATLSAHYDQVRQDNLAANSSLLGFGIICLLTGLGMRWLANSKGYTPSGPASAQAEACANVRELSRDRAGLLANMSRWLKEQFIMRLIDQRNDAVHGQQAASDRVEQINHRLSKLQPEIRDRIALYEKRIEDLERELSESNEMNQELIRTRISMAKKELEIEKAKCNISWN